VSHGTGKNSHWATWNSPGLGTTDLRFGKWVSILQEWAEGGQPTLCCALWALGVPLLTLMPTKSQCLGEGTRTALKRSQVIPVRENANVYTVGHNHQGMANRRDASTLWATNTRAWQIGEMQVLQCAGM
jgi:hypothetical protein